jgi:hypothetical protein
MYLSFVVCIKLVVTQKSLAKVLAGDVRWEVVDGFP